MILDFTIRLESNPDHADEGDVKNGIVGLFKEFSSLDNEENRRLAIEVFLDTLQAVGEKMEYTVRTFAEISR
jgi:hypothetical protein